MADDNPKPEDERTLAQVVKERGPLDAKDAVAITLDLLKTLSMLHGEGKVHRQICADTVRLDEKMSAKLDPFTPEVTIGGIGVDLIPCPPQLHNISPVVLPAQIKTAQQVLTEAGILLDPRQIDFYQLGALLCFMVSGHSVLDYLRSCKAKADVPKAIRPIVDRALGLNSKDCFESSDSFASELKAVISSKPGSKGPTSDLPDSILIPPASGVPADTAAVSEEAVPFKTLGHYELTERIGHGGMGDVYKAYEQALDRIVAIKVLPAGLARQKDFVKRFHAEATAIAKLDHPNIVRIYYSGQDQGHHFFAMQYVDGESLADLLARRKRLTPKEVLVIIEQCLAGIGAAHKRGLIHRDIKPGNVLLDRHSRRALVTDFGVVKSAQASTQITVTGTIMGTADYIAPEQARGSGVDQRTDLYAMGVLMYQMLSGRLPFDAKSATSMMFQHAYEPPPPLSEVATDVPEQLAAMVMKLMAKDPDDRYQSADEVLASLENIDLDAAKPSSTSQAGIIEAPEFYNTPKLPSDLTRLTGRNWFCRVRNRITDFLGLHAPQLIEHIQTTNQQLDGAVAEYQQRRDRLAELVKEAKASAENLEQQAKAQKRSAASAGRRAQNAAGTTAKHQALKEEQQSEQAAAELAQLGAEQSEQTDEISLRLAKVEAKLVQLRSGRDALKARMIVVNARLGTDRATSSKWRPRARLINAAIVLALLCLAVVFTYVFWPRTRFAELENIQGHVAILDFKNDARAYSNRKYIWKNIPEDFPLKKFAQVPGGGRASLTATVTKSGYIYITSATADNDVLTKAGWKKTSHIINYTDSGFSEMSVYRKFVEKGEFVINRLSWQGPILLLPSEPPALLAKPDTPASGLVAHWKFDEGSGAVAHDSVGNNHGTIHGAWWKDSKFGTALYFDGKNDYIDLTELPLGQSFTISLWADPSDLNPKKAQCFIGKHTYPRGDNIFLFGFYEGKLHVRIRDDAHLEGSPTKGWQHLVVVVQRIDDLHSNIWVYRNGIVLWTTTLDAVVGDMSGLPWTVGQDWDGYPKRTDFFNGAINDVRIYNGTLSAKKIQQLYDSQAGSHRPSTVQWASDLTAKLNDMSNWKVTGGQWLLTPEGHIRGSGDSRIVFKPKLPSDFMLSFRMNVIKGMRPRIFLDSDLFGNEGYKKTLWPYGPGVSSLLGKRTYYRNGQELLLKIHYQGDLFRFFVDNVLAAQGSRVGSDNITFCLRGGDEWSKGTTEFWDFKLEPAEIINDAAQRKLLWSEMAGDHHATVFGEVAEGQGGLLVGFNINVDGDSIGSLEPIYLFSDGESLGSRYGYAGRTHYVAKARRGYAVGGLIASTAGPVKGFKIVFMRIGNGQLEPNDSYESRWFGGQGSGPEIIIAGDAKPVIGVHGRSESHLNAIGLIQVETLSELDKKPR